MKTVMTTMGSLLRKSWISDKSIILDLDLRIAELGLGYKTIVTSNKCS